MQVSELQKPGSCDEHLVISKSCAVYIVLLIADKIVNAVFLELQWYYKY